MTKSRIIKDGSVYYSVNGAARFMRTNAATVKRLMGEGALEWLNLKTNGNLVIPESSILEYQRDLASIKRFDHQRGLV